MFTEFFFKVERSQKNDTVSSPNFGVNQRERSHSNFKRQMMMSPIQADSKKRQPVRGVLAAAVQPMIEEEKKEVIYENE